MSTSQKDSISIYGEFIEFEELAAAIYLRFASHFSGERQLSAFWLEMGMQEKQHAGLLQFCVADHHFAVDLPNRAEIHRMAALFKGLEKRAADPKLQIDEAFLIAMELEASEINGIYKHLTTSLHNSAYLLRRKIVTCVNHSEEVIEAARRFGLPSAVLKELARLQDKSCKPGKGSKRLRSVR